MSTLARSVVSAFRRRLSMSTCACSSGRPSVRASRSTMFTPHDEIPATNASIDVTASGVPLEASITTWLLRAWFSERPATPLVVERTRSLMMSSATVDHPLLHDVDHILERADVGRRVAVDRDEVGELAGRQRADVGVQTNSPRGLRRRRQARIDRWQPRAHQASQLEGEEPVGCVSPDADRHAELARPLGETADGVADRIVGVHGRGILAPQLDALRDYEPLAA